MVTFAAGVLVSLGSRLVDFSMGGLSHAHAVLILPKFNKDTDSSVREDYEVLDFLFLMNLTFLLEVKFCSKIGIKNCLKVQVRG